MRPAMTVLVRPIAAVHRIVEDGLLKQWRQRPARATVSPPGDTLTDVEYAAVALMAGGGIGPRRW